MLYRMVIGDKWNCEFDANDDAQAAKLAIKVLENKVHLFREIPIKKSSSIQHKLPPFP